MRRVAIETLFESRLGWYGTFERSTPTGLGPHDTTYNAFYRLQLASASTSAFRTRPLRLAVRAPFAVMDWGAITVNSANRRKILGLIKFPHNNRRMKH
jgi:hypothetical protein